MTRETITHATEAEWLAARKQDVTSTEAAALFGAGVYVKTPYELYHLKAGTVPVPEFQGNDRTRWGNRLEDAIARGIAEDLGLIVEPFKCYMRIPEVRMGSSFDYKVVGLVEGHEDNEARRLFAAHGPGIVECKNVDSLQFKRAWLDDGETVEAPVHIEFQTQHQLEVADLDWAIIAPLVGGNTPKPVIRIRDRDAGAAIRAKVADLWARIAAGMEPAPDFTKDGATIAAVYRDNDGSSVDLSDNARLAELCRAYKAAGADEKAAKERKDAAKAEILTIVKAAKAIAYQGGKISAGTTKESFRAYWRDESERISISLSTVKGAQIEATVPAFRNVRITEAA
ncbi:MAG: YqaJ viral recombinase family protein [Aestuariivirga sp.]